MKNKKRKEKALRKGSASGAGGERRFKMAAGRAL